MSKPQPKAKESGHPQCNIPPNFEPCNNRTKHRSPEELKEVYARSNCGAHRCDQINAYIQGIRKFQNRKKAKIIKYKVPNNVREKRVIYNHYLCNIGDPSVALAFVKKTEWLGSPLGRNADRIFNFARSLPSKDRKGDFAPYSVAHYLERFTQRSTLEVIKDLNYPQNLDCHTFIVFDSLFENDVLKFNWSNEHLGKFQEGLRRIFLNRISNLEQLKRCAQSQVIYVPPPVVGSKQAFWLAQLTAFESVRSAFELAGIAVVELVSYSKLARICGENFEKECKYDIESSPFSGKPNSAHTITKNTLLECKQQIEDVITYWIKSIESKYIVPASWPPEIPADYTQGDNYHYTFRYRLKAQGQTAQAQFLLEGPIESKISEYADILINQSSKRPTSNIIDCEVKNFAGFVDSDQDSESEPESYSGSDTSGSNDLERSDEVESMIRNTEKEENGDKHQNGGVGRSSEANLGNSEANPPLLTVENQGQNLSDRNLRNRKN